MSDILAFVVPNRVTIVGRTVEHIAGVGVAIWTAVPVGIAIASIALFALLNDASAPVTENLA